jgi:ankyrin repeat protein
MAVGLIEDVRVALNRAIDAERGPLLKEVAAGNVENARRLLDAGAGVNEPGRLETCLGCAISQTMHVEMVKLLLNYGPNLEYTLYRALLLAKEPQFEIAELLIDAGADVNENLRRPLIVQCLSTFYRCNTLEQATAVICFLLDAGADINQEDDDGTTVTTVAKQLHLVDLANMLAERGGIGKDAETVDEKFVTALYDNPVKLDVVRQLLEAGADVESQFGVYCASERFCDACRAGDVELVRVFIQNGKDLRGSVYYTLCVDPPCNEIAMRLPVARMLLDAGADMRFHLCVNGMLSGRCSTEDKVAVLNFFLENGADVNSTDDHGEVLLMNRWVQRYPAVAKILLEHGADVNARDNFKGKTLLMLACDGLATAGTRALYAIEDLVKMLLDAGADITATSREGKTCVDLIEDLIGSHLRYKPVWWGNTSGRLEVLTRIREMFVFEQKKIACRVIKRALWKLVQRRRQLETLDELYRPGSIGAERGRKIFEDYRRFGA